MTRNDDHEAARLLRVYGANPARWPGGVEGKAWQAACENPRLQALRAGHAQLDNALDAARPEPPSEAFMTRLYGDAGHADLQRSMLLTGWMGRMRSLLTAHWPQAGVLAAALVAGLALGYAIPAERQPAPELVFAAQVLEAAGEDMQAW
jgi:hypothetical protein